MKRTPARRSNLFLMELIIAIFFFSLAGALCMQLFLKARTLSADTSNQNHALTQAKSAAAVFETGDGTLEGISQFFSGSVLSDSGNELNIYYDKSWNFCKETDAKFRMTIMLEEDGNANTSSSNALEGTLRYGIITIFDGDETLCSLKVSFYLPLTV